MPHLRSRHLAEPFTKLLGFAKILGVFGHRQVGKTTFLEHHSAEMVTLDDEETYNAAIASPKKFLSELRGNHSAIDECQLVPGLFPALKIAVHRNQMPGQYILSGSVRFTSRKVIRESLTGRISQLELYPFVLTELTGDTNSSFFLRLFEARTFSSLAQDLRLPNALDAARSKAIELYLVRGGLPGICFVREASVRQSLLKNLLETILDRDLRMIYPTSVPYSQLLEFCHQIAQLSGQILRPTEVRRRTRLSEVTQKKLLYALESVFLIRRIPIEGDYRGDTFYFEDQAESAFLKQAGPTPQIPDWAGLLYRNIRAQFGYRIGHETSYFQYRTRGGVLIPICLRSNGKNIGILPIEARSDFDRSLKAQAESFLKRYPESQVLAVTRSGREVDVVSDRIGIVPAQIALF